MQAGTENDDPAKNASSRVGRFLRWGLVVLSCAAVALAVGVGWRWRERVAAAKELHHRGLELAFAEKPHFAESLWSDAAFLRPLKSVEMTPLRSRRSGSSSVDRSFVAALARFPECRALRLERCNGLDADFFARLEAIPSLEELDLFRCAEVDDAACSAIAKLKSLRYVALVDSYEVQDAGAFELSTLPQLEKLVLAGTPVTDAFLSRPFAPNLKVLDIRRARTTDLGRVGPAEWRKLACVCVSGPTDMRLPWDREGTTPRLVEQIRAPVEVPAEKVLRDVGFELPPFPPRKRHRFTGLRPTMDPEWWEY